MVKPAYSLTIGALIGGLVGGAVSILATKNRRNTVSFMEFGLSKVIGVSVLLIGTGTIAGIIKASALQYDVINLLEAMKMPAFVFAPLSGILMAASTVVAVIIYPIGNFIHKNRSRMFPAGPWNTILLRLKLSRSIAKWVTVWILPLTRAFCEKSYQKASEILRFRKLFE